MMQKDLFSRDQVVAIIESVMQKATGSITLQDTAFAQELQALHGLIHTFHQELVAVYPGEILDNHIPSATDELDAVITMTEEATNNIMGACDNIQQIFPEMTDAVSDKIGIQIIRIIEACTFQDLTGQRISKVMTFLKDIDAKTVRLLDIMTQRFGFVPSQSEPKPVQGDKALMNGPQLPGQGLSQADIDRLLSDFN